MRVAITDFVAAYPQNGSYRIERPDNYCWLERQAPLWGLADAVNLAGHLETTLQNARDLSVVVGTSKGDLGALAHWADPQSWEWMPGALAARLAHRFGAGGQALCPNAACATGAHALALGAQLIQNGAAQTVLAGAFEFVQPEIILAAYRNMNALSKSGMMRPFDTRRDGFVPASGGAFFLLEAEARARKRGANIHGFLTGTSLHCDAHHMTSMSPGGETIARAIRNALQKAGNPRIDYINAHGTATQNDLIEARAIRSVFGNSVAVSSTKPLTGHLLGASGAVEAAICLLAMRDGFAPPTLNLEEVESDLGLDLVRGRGREMEIRASLSLNYGFGGHIGALIFEKS